MNSSIRWASIFALVVSSTVTLGCQCNSEPSGVTPLLPEGGLPEVDVRFVPRVQIVEQTSELRIDIDWPGRATAAQLGVSTPSNAVRTTTAPRGSREVSMHPVFDDVLATSDAMSQRYGVEFECVMARTALSDVFYGFIGRSESESRSYYFRSTELGCISQEAFQAQIDDAIADFVDSISSAVAGFNAGFVDIRRATAGRNTRSQEHVDGMFNNSVVPCDASSEEDAVVCATGVADMPSGDVVMLRTEVSEAIPLASADKSLIYAFVFDSDGDAANNWVAQGDFDWDYFQGTDRWYQLMWDHSAQAWSLTVTQVDAQQQTSEPASSTARAYIYGTDIYFFVSASELPNAPLSWRATAFAHDGNFTQETRGGDVVGANPTEALPTLE